MIAASARNDFPDALSPMLVKELRQGLRSRIFMAAFYLTQGLMILSVIFNLVASQIVSSSADPMAVLNGLFWFMISVPLLFFMPLRGFAALHGELKSGTLELVFLSRLSALRIATGKWLALVVQTLLLVTAVLPYVLIRYFLGGIDILDDLRNLGILVLASATLSALTIAISPYESKLLRALFVIGLIMAFQTLFGVVLAWITVGRMGGGGTSFPMWKAYLVLAAFLPAFIMLCLEMAAARIAPPAENHAVRKRLIGIYFLVAGYFFTLIGLESYEVMGLALILTAPVIIDALAEQTIFTPSLLKARTPVWRGLGYLILPGWASAVWYVAAFSVLAAIFLGLSGELSQPEDSIRYIAFFGSLLVPAAIIRLILPDTQYFLAIYVGLQFVFAVVTVLAGVATQMLGKQILEWLAPIPLSVFMLSLFDQVPRASIDSFVIITTAMTVAALLLLLVRTAAPWRDITRTLRQARATNV